MVWESTLVPSLHEIFNFPPGGFVFQTSNGALYIQQDEKKTHIGNSIESGINSFYEF